MTLLVDPAKDNDAGEPVVRNNDVHVEQKGSAANEFQIPDKFKGKSPEEIARSYVELEKEFGRVRNDVGEYRSLTDRLLQLEEKRVSDLEGAGAKVEAEFNIDPAELLSNPRESLTKWYEHQRKSDPEYRALQERLNAIEGHVKQQVVTSKHADAEQITNDPDFHDYVKAHPVRLSIAQAAVQNGDVNALDYLLTEYKERKGARQEPEPKQDSETSTARRVATEKASSGGPTAARTGGDKVFSRRKLIQLKISNPDEYAAMQDQILLAYAQGRVVD
jgi:hypothetical protein